VRIRLLVVSTAIAFLPQLVQAQTDCGLPSPRGDQWSVAATETVGLDGATLCAVVKWLEDSKQRNVHAVLVARHRTLVFERYFSGSDEHWGQMVGEALFGPETKHDERSVTKSVIALLLGIAVERGLIKGIDEPVLSFFPEYSDLRTPEKDRITLRHLLTMSAGLEWHEHDTPYANPANSENRMDNAPDPFRFVLEQAVVAQPGQIWNYNTGSMQLISAVLKKATGKSVDELARMLLFEPLGITDVEWFRDGQADLRAKPNLRLRPRDLAKIGQLVLQHGAWDGKEIVPASWIDMATTQQFKVSGWGWSFDGYGYFFWLGRSHIDGREVRWVAAQGLGGQRLFIVPALDLVVVVNAGLYKSYLQGSVPFAILNQYVLKATGSQP
jgi:CubicO group peptidase (beta-lactamase class C family)